MVVGENKRSNIMDGIENTGDVRLHDHRLRLKQRFDIVRKLGQGTYGKVQLGINKKTGQEVAIKTIKKCKIESEADLVRIRREVQIMSSVRHPNIVHIYEVFENSEKMILVMEYCSGGELYDFLSQKKVLQEDEARRLFRQIATAVYYCHIHKICHRDLKLENVLLDDTGSAKIADFGLSNVFKETSLLSTFCGSPLYASPEIVKGTPYIGPEVDCWSLGVLLYTLVYGAMPFDGSNFKRLVRQISNGDYYEPKAPSSASPLIRDMLTVDPLKRAAIVYICDHPWVNEGYPNSCLEISEALAAETPVRLDLLLSLAPAASSNSNAVVVPDQEELGPEESCTDLTSSTSMAVEPSNSAEKRILDLVAEGGEDAIKPSPTRTIVSASDGKRKLELAMSASGLQRKKERVASSARIPPEPAVPPTVAEHPQAEEVSQLVLDEASTAEPTTSTVTEEITIQPSLKSSATMIISPAADDCLNEIVQLPTQQNETPREEVKEKTSVTRPRVTVKKKASPPKSSIEKSPIDTQEDVKEESKTSPVSSATDKLTGLSITQPSVSQTPTKPKKLSIPGGNVGSFKEQFERRASLTAAPDIKRNLSKPIVSKIAKPKAQSEDRELQSKTSDSGTVRLQQIGIEPSQKLPEDINRSGGVKKTESEPSHGTPSVDPTVLLQDARRSLQNSMAKLVEEKTGEENRRRAARDIISSAIRTGKPPMPYGRSSSAGVTSLASPPGTPPVVPSTAPITVPPHARTFRTEATHKVHDHRNRGTSVERIIPISVAEEGSSPTTPPIAPPSKPAPVAPKITQPPLRRLVSSESANNESCSSLSGEPIKKSAREFIIPIAVEGKGYVTPRQGSLEPETTARHVRTAKPRRISSLVSGGESEEEDDSHMHRLRSSRAARAESVSSGEEEEDDEGFHLLTADNLFSTLLHRVRALTNRLNGEEGPGFSQHPHTLFNNLQSPFFNSPHLSRRHNTLREGWGTRDLHADFDSMFNKRQPFPRGNTKKSSKHQTKLQQNADSNLDSGLDLSDLDLSAIQLSEKEMETLSGLTPALSRRLQKQLLAQLPPAAARTLRRTLSLQNTGSTRDSKKYSRSHSANKYLANNSPAESGRLVDATKENDEVDTSDSVNPDSKHIRLNMPETETPKVIPEHLSTSNNNSDKTDMTMLQPQYCTLPRPKRCTALSRESTPPIVTTTESGYDYTPKINYTLNKDANHSRGSSVRSTPDRPLLSKYLTPERTLSLDESFSSDSGSILSEPSYIAAYGSPAFSGFGLRRHSMRVSADPSKKRISRFLRPDFFDTPQDESIYVKHKKEKELETQKVLREIREKKNKVLDPLLSSRSPVEAIDMQQLIKEENRKCLSPLSIITGKDRSRSNTPFYPILDNIRESVVDSSHKYTDMPNDKENSSQLQSAYMQKESKLIRPKSYPVKTEEITNQTKSDINKECIKSNESELEFKEVIGPKDSKLLRPKSYPSSSPSPEKVYIGRINRTDTSQSSVTNEEISVDSKADVEVSFNISLPKKAIEIRKNDILNADAENLLDKNSYCNDKDVLVIKKSESKHCSNEGHNLNKCESKDSESISTLNIPDNKTSHLLSQSVTNACIDQQSKVNIIDETNVTKTEMPNNTKEVTEKENSEKKPTIKKKIIKKVSSKTKTDTGESQGKYDSKTSDKKKVIKKPKSDESVKVTKDNVVKKKSVLQSIGQKFEKFAYTKSSDKDKLPEIQNSSLHKDQVSELNRKQREHSVPVQSCPCTDKHNIKRAVTLTDVAALENQSVSSNKTTVSKVLGLFKRTEPKEKATKSEVSKVNSESMHVNNKCNSLPDTTQDSSENKPKRPTSLLLNGLGRKNKYSRNMSDTVSILSMPNTTSSENTTKKEESKKLRSSLKLDFSKLPRVKKIVPTNPVIEQPHLINTSPINTEMEKNKNEIDDEIQNTKISENRYQSRSRSKSDNSSVDTKADINSSSVDTKVEMNSEKGITNAAFSNDFHVPHHPHRTHEATTPEKEDIVERIRRKSFYSRFNEKRLRRKSSLVGPGSTEYDPVARLHSQSESKYDVSPTSPVGHDLSPGFSVASDLSPSTERYRTLMTDLHGNSRNSLRLENFGIHDKADSYRSLDRNDFRKYSSNRNYLDYDTPTFTSNRYTRTMSLLNGPDKTDDLSLSHLREPLKYNRTMSMYAPGSYATYRPKRVRNSAIILRENEKEPSPENIMDKIRNKKISISVTRKPDPDKEENRSNVPSKSEGDCAERSEKID